MWAGHNKLALGFLFYLDWADYRYFWCVQEEGEAVEIKEGEFFVRRVMAARKLSTSKPEFLISWYNYSAEHDSWEPLDCLNDCPLTYRWASATAKTAAQKYASKWVRPE